MAAAAMKLATAVACALVLFATACHGLELGYYKRSCPRVEAIVRDEVKKFVYKDAGIGAGLIRLVFHDCFVEVRYIYTRISSLAHLENVQKRCPANPTSSNDPTVNQDAISPNALDNQYYKNILAHKVLFASDATLLTSPTTGKMVSDNANIPGWWEEKFKNSFVKMASIGVKTGYQGEIRRHCRLVN
ncbi:hypothetical protein ABZP36_006565 [Zizania latifolia]